MTPVKFSMFCSSWDLLPCNAKVASAMTALYNRELTTTSGGNVSVKDEDGSVWMTPTVYTTVVRLKS